MAKRGSKTTKKQTLWSKTKAKYSSFYKKRKKTTILLTIVAILVIAYGVRASYEWTQFKIAERKVNNLYKLSIEELGEPTKKTVGGSCGHASSKFQQGDLGCGYGFTVTYKASDLEEANRIANQFDDTVKNQKEIRSMSKTQERPFDLTRLYFGSAEIVYEQKENILRISCGARVIHAGEAGYYLSRGVNDRVVISFSCNKSPLLRPIYPVKD